jgi:NifU-like protein
MGREALEAAIENYRSGGKRKHQLEGKVVCTCFGVTEPEIERVIRENDLRTVEQVTNYTKAGGGCGGCREEIAKIIARVRGEPVRVEAAAPPRRRLTTLQKIKLIEETIEREIRPSLRQDGGDIELVDVEGNRVLVSFRGACAQCRTAEFTLKEVVQARLREFVSDDLVVEEVKP